MVILIFSLESIKKQPIFYGLGDNAELFLDKAVSEGITPVCFSPSNPNNPTSIFPKSVGKNGQYPVLQLLDATRKYLDYVVYPTNYKDRISTVENLLKLGIPAERICFIDGYRWKRGCWQLYHDLRLRPVKFGLTPCCYFRHNPPHVKATGNWLQDYQEYIGILNDTMNKLALGENTQYCVSCPSLKYGFYPEKPDFFSFSVGNEFGSEMCNCRCFYCSHVEKDASGKRRIKKIQNNLNILNALSTLESFLPNVKNFTYAALEPTVSKDHEKWFAFIREHNWKYTPIMTNAMIYDEDIANFVKNGSMLDVSIDCGTREKYIEIKGVDYFDKVVDNLKRYSALGNGMLLKYIFLEGINDNKAEVDAFFEIVKMLNEYTPIKTILSYNGRIVKVDSSFSENIRSIFNYFIASALKNKVVCVAQPEQYAPKERDYWVKKINESKTYEFR